MTSHIVCAALRDRESGLVVCGPRHYDEIMTRLMSASIETARWDDPEMGFVDADGEFYSRAEAWEIAKEHGQIIHPSPSDSGSLQSTHLY